MMAIFLLFLMGLPAMDAKKKHSTIRITTDPTVYGHFIDGSVHKQWGVYLYFQTLSAKEQRPNRLLRDWQFGYSTVAILKLANSMRNQQRSG